jgi:hypothetical protein
MYVENAAEYAERKQFEAWVRTRLDKDVDPSILNDFFFDDEDDAIVYLDDTVQMLWETWRAARKFTVENVEEIDTHQTGGDHHEEHKHAAKTETERS